MPFLKTTSYGTGDFRWLLNTHSLRAAATCVLTASTFTKATHYAGDFFASGLIVNAADMKSVKPFTGAVGEKFAVLVGDHKTDGVENVNAAVLLGQGTAIKTSLLPLTTNLPATAPSGFIFVTGV